MRALPAQAPARTTPLRAGTRRRIAALRSCDAGRAHGRRRRADIRCSRRMRAASRRDQCSGKEVAKGRRPAWCASANTLSRSASRSRRSRTPTLLAPPASHVADQVPPPCDDFLRSCSVDGGREALGVVSSERAGSSRCELGFE